MSRRSPPTLDDVARRAQVSTATVSRCFNSPELVSKETRDRVMGAVTELGYTPNFGARAMAAQRTMTIGAVIPTLENAMFAQGLQAFQETLHAQGYTLLLASSSYQQDVEAEQVRALIGRGAEGLLLIGHDRSADLRRYLDVQGVPTLVAWTYDPDGALPSVGFDNRGAMRSLTEEVLNLGHRRLAMISAPTANNDRARLRILGARDAMRAADLDPGGLTVIDAPHAIEAGQRALSALMDQATPPTAVLCGNDVLAVGAALGARDLGLKVPDHVSITGFADIEIARVVTPAITTVHVPHSTMGQRAAETLIEMVQGTEITGAQQVPTEITWRGSLGPPPL